VISIRERNDGWWLVELPDEDRALLIEALDYMAEDLGYRLDYSDKHTYGDYPDEESQESVGATIDRCGECAKELSS
jgi:hypothetical protein